MSDEQELTPEIAARLFGGKATDPPEAAPRLNAESEQPQAEARAAEPTPEQSHNETLLYVLRPETRRAKDLALIRMLHGPPGG
jgi:hypothetical protein